MIADDYISHYVNVLKKKAQTNPPSKDDDDDDVDDDDNDDNNDGNNDDADKNKDSEGGANDDGKDDGNGNGNDNDNDNKQSGNNNKSKINVTEHGMLHQIEWTIWDDLGGGDTDKITDNNGQEWSFNKNIDPRYGCHVPNVQRDYIKLQSWTDAEKHRKDAENQSKFYEMSDCSLTYLYGADYFLVDKHDTYRVPCVLDGKHVRIEPDMIVYHRKRFLGVGMPISRIRIREPQRKIDIISQQRNDPQFHMFDASEVTLSPVYSLVFYCISFYLFCVCVCVMLCLCFCSELYLARYHHGDIQAWRGMPVCGSNKYHHWPIDTPKSKIKDFEDKYLENQGVLLDGKIENGEWMVHIKFDGLFDGMAWIPASFALYLDQHASSALGFSVPPKDILTPQPIPIVCAYLENDNDSEANFADSEDENNSDTKSLDSNQTPPPNCQVSRSFGMLCDASMICYACCVMHI